MSSYNLLHYLYQARVVPIWTGWF